MTNPVMNATQNHIGTAIQIRPPQSVATQLNVFTAEGTAIAIVASMNTNRTLVAIPVPKMSLRASLGMIVEMMPNAGSTITYTSGWAKNQKMFWYSNAPPSGVPFTDARMCVPKFRSERTKVSAIESDGSAKIRSTELIRVAQTNRGMFQ